MVVRTRALLLTGAVLAGLVAGCGSSDGATAPDAAGAGSGSPAPGATYHRITSLVTVQGVPDQIRPIGRVAFPTTWRKVHRPGGTLRLREGKPACTYTLDVGIGIELDHSGDATAAARRLVPTKDGTLLESGHRTSMAWRVVRRRTVPRPDRRQIVVMAVSARPLRWISKQAGQPAWMVIRIRALSDPGDECHSGTYRDTLGPALGDALATARTRP